jgi:hypothetical protein
MNKPHRAARIAATLFVALAASFVSTLANAAPGDRVTRHPYPLTSPIPDIPGRSASSPYPQIAMRGDEYVAVWIGERGITARRFAWDGTAFDDEILVRENVPGWYFESPSVTVGADLSFVVAWRRNSATTTESVIEARGWTGSLGNPPPRTGVITVSTSTSRPVRGVAIPTSVAMDPNLGRFAVAWTGYDQPISDRQIPFVRVYYGSGNPVARAFSISAVPTVSHTARPKIAFTAQGIVVAYAQADRGAPLELRAKLLTRDGLPVANSFQVSNTNADGEVQLNFDLAVNANGDILVAYRRKLPGVERGGIYARRFAFAATAPQRGGEIGVATGTSLPGNGDLDAAIDDYGGNTFVVAWMGAQFAPGGPFLHTRLFRANGTPVTSTAQPIFDRLLESPSSLNVGSGYEGRFTLVFKAQVRNANGGTGQAILAQLFAGVNDTRASCQWFAATQVGTNGNNTIVGTAGDDVIHALGGNDRVTAGAGDDVICGGDGADVIYGEDGADLISGGSGDDVLDGGDGSDRCSGDGHTNADSAVQCESVPTVP